MPSLGGFEPYQRSHRVACLRLFDLNCPAFFAPNERDDYTAFLDTTEAGYWVVPDGGAVAGAFGVFRADADKRSRLNWIMIDPSHQGSGLGRRMMTEALAIARGQGASVLEIAASHLSAPFFSRFSAREVIRTEDGWGAGMHRVDMELAV